MRSKFETKYIEECLTRMEHDYLGSLLIHVMRDIEKAKLELESIKNATNN